MRYSREMLCRLDTFPLGWFGIDFQSLSGFFFVFKSHAWFFFKELLFFANFLPHVLTILSIVRLYFVSVIPVSEVLGGAKSAVCLFH